MLQWCHSITDPHTMINSSQARKDSVIAELKWFYRVSELPEATYSLLMEDRMKGKHTIQFGNFSIPLSFLETSMASELCY